MTRHTLKLVKLAGLIYLLTALGCVAIRTQVEMPPQRAEEIEFEVIKELEQFRGKIKKDLRVTAGGFFDKTGQHKDSVRTRYSKAVTQGGEELLYHTLFKALGPRAVVDRQVDTWNRLTTEYQYSWVSPAAKGRHAGLIKYGGPAGWIVGADYLVTGAVVYANEDRYSGGGGLNVDGAGAHFRKIFSRIGIELRLVDMTTSEICWSTMVESWVSGTEIGMDLFRFITAWGDEYLVSAEAGRAQYLPTDHALQVCMATAVVDMIKENKGVFIAGHGARKEKATPSTGETKAPQKPGVEENQTPPPDPGAMEGQKRTGKDQGPSKPQKAGEGKKAEAPEQKKTQKPHWLKRPGAVGGW